MNWISITTQDLNDTKVGKLVEACRTKALASGQSDPSLRIIESVVSRIRSEIKGCASHSLDSDLATIPKDLKSLATRMILRELQSRLQIELNQDEREEWRQDIRYLERIASCEIPVLAPDSPESTSSVQPSGSGSPRTSRRSRIATRQSMEGL
jgi:hypothetical protein